MKLQRAQPVSGGHLETELLRLLEGTPGKEGSCGCTALTQHAVYAVQTCSEGHVWLQSAAGNGQSGLRSLTVPAMNLVLKDSPKTLQSPESSRWGSFPK